jgi:hypothetical protein
MGTDQAAVPSRESFGEAHAMALGLTAVSGASLGLAIWALEKRLERQDAEVSSTCGTFSECVQPTGEFVLLVMFVALLLPTAILVPARVTRAWLVVPLGAIVALFLGMAWSAAADLLAMASALALVVGTSVSYMLTELMVGRGYPPGVRWGSLTVTVVVLAAWRLFVG